MAFNTKLLEMLGIGYPILLAPMAGSGTPELAIAVSEAGGLGSLPCAMLSPEQIEAQVRIVQQRTNRSINLNFFCHTPPEPDPVREAAWKRRAAFALGASAVQIGTAYLFCPEAGVSSVHARALREAHDDGTALTNVFTGRPARSLRNRAVAETGPMSDDAPAFPMAAGAWAPVRAKAEAGGSGDFSPLWAGQAAALGRE
ncbi:MAG: NAD(P)H-dependent flavin oxidoreductase, partial [Rhodomicrobium sp.]